jgi:hypothetical protein
MKLQLKFIYLILLPVLLIILFLSAFSSQQIKDDSTGNANIIKFSHSFHKDLAECDVCHTAVKTSKSIKDRLMPNHDACKQCHEEVDKEDKCNKCHYGEMYETLIQNTSSNIIFDHSFHLENQKVKCEACHKGISDVDYAYKAIQPYPIMENCYSCHSDKGKGTSSCEACHISTVNLKPLTHQSVNFIKSHKYAAKEMNANCIMCHDANNNSCITCHAANSVNTSANTPSDFYAPYLPNNFKDGTKQQQITRVHDLNYTYTHGIDLKGKAAECQTCHETETFCGNCHSSRNSDFSLGGITPTSHFAIDFVTGRGVGTGGGKHSVLARRDIESCQACHDVQGADPICVTCHTDADGIKGTDPKTHPSGFMHNVHGDWHDSNASVCFNCHTRFPATPGQRFCGYCHGAK